MPQTAPTPPTQIFGPGASSSEGPYYPCRHLKCTLLSYGGHAEGSEHLLLNSVLATQGGGKLAPHAVAGRFAAADCLCKAAARQHRHPAPHGFRSDRQGARQRHRRAVATKPKDIRQRACATPRPYAVPYARPSRLSAWQSSLERRHQRASRSRE